MRPRLYRAVGNTVAVMGVLAGLLGSGLALVLSVYTRYDAKAWHFILIGGVALLLIVAAAVIHFCTRMYERRRVIRDCWDVVKDADTLDPDEDPAIDPDMISQKTIDALAAEVVEELADDIPVHERKAAKKKMKVALGAAAIALPVALTGALIAMQKKLKVYESKNTVKKVVVKVEGSDEAAEKTLD